MNWNNYGNILLRVCVLLLSIICVWLYTELREQRLQKLEWKEMYYEQSAVIDSLMGEGEAIKHWYEESERYK